MRPVNRPLTITVSDKLPFTFYYVSSTVLNVLPILSYLITNSTNVYLLVTCNKWLVCSRYFLSVTGRAVGGQSKPH